MAPAETEPCPPGSPPHPLSLTASLGIQGWETLDPLLVASLAGELPLLLVGAHGTAKSLLVERVAAKLGLCFRHYNASLLNYDDLVGIPLPDEQGAGLRFVGTPGAIWGAEFVFVDELSRCRADLQNKLFPIIHERRVAGIALEGLRHRWAAMNPPAPEEADPPPGGEVYLGTELLDPALADRFSFVVRVPGWSELTREQRQQLVAGDYAPTGRPDEWELAAVVLACSERVTVLEDLLRDRLASYIVALVPHLEAAGLPQSPRRARMWFRSILYVYAAALTLGADSDLEQCTVLAIRNGLPQTAGEVPPSPAAVMAAHRQAWEVSGLARDSAWRQVLEEPDPVRRVLVGDALSLSDLEMSRLVTQAVATERSEARRVGLAVALFLRFRESRDLTAAAWEVLAQLSRRVLEPSSHVDFVHQGKELQIWREISGRLAVKGRKAPGPTTLERNYLLAGYPDLWMRCDWREAHARFRSDLELLCPGWETTER